MSTPDIDESEVRQRVLYAFVQATARISDLFEIKLKGLERLTHMGAFHVLRKQNLGLNDIATRLGISRRKVDQLSGLLKRNFFGAHTDHLSGAALDRRIEFMLWAEPLGVRRIKQVLGTEPVETVGASLARLVQAGRIAEVDGRYQVTMPTRRLVRDDWIARIDGLSHQLSAVSKAAIGRLVDENPHAFVRTVSMRVRKDQFAKLEALYTEVLWPELVALDAECQDSSDPESESVVLSICWAPE